MAQGKVSFLTDTFPNLRIVCWAFTMTAFTFISFVRIHLFVNSIQYLILSFQLDVYHQQLTIGFGRIMTNVSIQRTGREICEYQAHIDERVRNIGMCSILIRKVQILIPGQYIVNQQIAIQGNSKLKWTTFALFCRPPFD